jgi:hypothetical protein
MSMDLTNTMKQALKRIERQPGTPSKLLPGGTRTAQALMRRGRIEVQGDDWRAYLPEHEHRFVTTLHLDGCHFYETRAECACGVLLRSVGERSGDYAEVWMDNPDDCARCRRLLEGARPRYDVVIARREDYGRRAA